MKHSTRAYWIVGVMLAFFGVAVARWVSVHVPSDIVWVTTIGGQLLALGGLFIIALGTRRRRKHRSTIED